MALLGVGSTQRQKVPSKNIHSASVFALGMSLPITAPDSTGIAAAKHVGSGKLMAANTHLRWADHE
jgi:hypothetical protein